MTEPINPEGTEPEAPEEVVPDYSRLGFRDLQKLCKARGLSGEGKAPALIIRLQEHDALHGREVDTTLPDEPDEEVDLLADDEPSQDAAPADDPQTPADGGPDASPPPSAGHTLTVQPGSAEVGATATATRGPADYTVTRPSSPASPAVVVRADPDVPPPASGRRGQPDLTTRNGLVDTGPASSDGSVRKFAFRAEFLIGHHELTDAEHFRYIAETHGLAIAAGHSPKGGPTIGERVGYAYGSAGRVVVYQVGLRRQ